MKVHFLFLILAALAAMVMAKDPPPPCSHAHLEWKQSRGTWKPKKDKFKQRFSHTIDLGGVGG